MNMKIDPILLDPAERTIEVLLEDLPEIKISKPEVEKQEVSVLPGDNAESLPELLADDMPDLPKGSKSEEGRRGDNIPVLILSALEGTAYYAQPIVQHKVALADNGVLYLTENAEQDVLVMDYIARLDRRRELTDGKESPYQIKKTVPYTEIQRLNAHGSGNEELSVAEIARQTAEEAEVIAIIREGAKLEASDIFFEIPTRGFAQIKYRIAGDIEPRFRMKPERMRRLIRTVYEAMCESKSDPNYDPLRDQTARIARTFVDGLELHQCRVSTGPTDEEKPFLALRLHYDMGEPKTMVDLGFTQDHQDMLYDVAGFSSGINLFTGPTGCGKTTTLANIVGHWQKSHDYRYMIQCLEDPPEIPILGAIQKAISRKGGSREEEARAWVEGFETLMRWNPNWIIAGELRLRETMDVALKSALTNHLTWGSLHASSATLAPVRLWESGIDMSYLCDPEIFRIFVNQSLAPQLCPHCSISYSDGADSLPASLRRRIESLCLPDSVRLRDRHGCQHCHRGALRRRTICAEVMPTEAAAMDIFRKKGAVELRKFWVHERGGKTKTAHLIEKVNSGLIDPADAERLVSPLDTDKELRI
ncbi:ATPase, T2SS/T4P/T4SS family [Bordetella sp. FB-8]|uniref:ATPase, T2SS/T4P/T4SS family n=1 Tax=Bordetella sp. FB-8 TaxID=1159870 RepID=UPI00037BBB25|nr:ATPase, T2SS/T4P/T4SS family [Bordetella sp. FB-8]